MYPYGLDRMSTTPVAPASLDLPPQVKHTADLLFDRKAKDVIVLDLRGISSATDFFLIATGTSDTHVASIADHVVEENRGSGLRPVNVEGARGGRWILVDYFDFVVHVFHPAAREFYQLEHLWGDAPAHVLDPEAAGA